MFKVIVTIFLFFLFASILFAQTAAIITQEDLAQPGYVIYVVHDSLPEVAIAKQIMNNIGVQQTWNFTNMHSHFADTVYIVESNQTLYQNVFSNANICAVKAEEGKDFYIQNNSIGLFIEGNASNAYSSNSKIIKRSPPLQIIRYPYTYLDTLSSTSLTDETSYYGKNVKIGKDTVFVDSTRIIATTCQTSFVDAYGDLYTPNNIFNAIRQNITRSLKKEVFNYIQGQGWSYYKSIVDTSFQLKWWAENAQYPIVECSYYARNDYDSIYDLKFSSFRLIDSSEGIENAIQSPNILVYPNPASELVNFANLPTDAYYIKIYTILGKLLLEEKLLLGSQKYTLSLSKLSDGVYHCSLFDKNIEKLTQYTLIKQK